MSQNSVVEYENENSRNNKRQHPISNEESTNSSLMRKRKNPKATLSSLHSDASEEFECLRLEAIFHPKFENEKSNHQIRNEMVHMIEEKKGYLEVSLKHSGSLVLWSGGQRFYSKNSLCNQFTLAAEILLRQHFERSFRRGQNGAKKYQECSNFVESSRLTCAFEVVTSVLGDHGDIPNRDFLILTAVADRSKESFYSTPQVLEFSQRFRLPHNDDWAFTSPSSAQALFKLYDTSRETGLASDIVAALNKSADAHVASMYPHHTFQGEVLEGFIIRYIPYDDGSTAEIVSKQMEALAKTAETILETVPPSLPSSYEVHDLLQSALFGSNIRTIFEDVDGYQRGMAAAESFGNALEKVLSTADGGKRRTVRRSGERNLDLPALTKELAQSSDYETRRISSLLQQLSKLNKAITYAMVQEQQPSYPERTLCVIHVHHDQTFFRYQQAKAPEGMNLFRGFSIEMLKADEASRVTDTSQHFVSEAETGMNRRRLDSPNLMLKMKLLPYMVRTFICRNHLNVLQQSGEDAFVNSAKKLLCRWEISKNGQRHWIPFFEAWASYAKPRLNKEPTHAEKNAGLPKLTSFSYLKHLEHFTNLLEKGKIVAPLKSGFRGMACIISTSKITAKRGAEAFAGSIGCKNIMHLADAAKGNINEGIVSFGSVADHWGKGKKNKELLDDASKYLALILLGCSPEEIETEKAGDSRKTVKKLKGMRRSWDEQSCYVKIVLPKTILRDEGPPNSDDFQAALHKINEAAKHAPTEASEQDVAPGVTIFFPGIPGCGKSSLSKDIGDELEKQFATESTVSRRKVTVLMGDQVGKTFWQKARAIRKKDPSGIFIADKNTPPSSWKAVGDLCSATNGVPLAVFPEKSVLTTTRVLGERKPNGDFNAKKSHFYPFSMTYLAICVARVLKRKPSSHPGKLDRGNPTAAMIVVMFYSLYRYKAAEDLQESIGRRLEENNAFDLLEPIELPFLNENCADLPTEMEEILTEALQLQLGYDNARAKVKIVDPKVKAMEEKLRDCFDTLGENLLSTAADYTVTKRSFLDQIVSRIQQINSEDIFLKNSENNLEIKLVALDVSLVEVHKILKDNAAAAVEDMLEKTSEIGGKSENLSDKLDTLNEFVKQTHLTMEFWQRSTQEMMKEKYSHLLDKRVKLNVTGLLWDEHVAALSVDVAVMSSDGIVVPPCANSFSHITVWVAKGAKASMSNQLPQLVNDGSANHLTFVKPIPILGTFSFWDFDNNKL